MFNRFFLEWKMRSPLFRWAVNAALIPLIYLAAYIGGSLGIQGIALDISLIWPAAGISLAVVLLFGYRSLPGIFLGYLLFNFIELYSYNDPALLSVLPIALMVAAGSTFGTFLGSFIIRRFSYYEYFSSLKDVLIFLLPASLLSCAATSFIGTTTIYTYGAFDQTDFLYVWLTFFLGDLMGVYTFTPLLVVWLLKKPENIFAKHFVEAGATLLIFCAVTYVTFGMNFRLTHLYLPLCIWAAYRYSMHGATLAVFITSFLTVLLTSMNYGPFVATDTLIDPLLYLVSFLEVIVATSLIIAAAVKERELTLDIIKEQNISLQKEVNRKLEDVRSVYNEMFLKEKQACIGKTIFQTGREVLKELEKVRQSASESQSSVNRMRKELKKERQRFPTLRAQELQRELQEVEDQTALMIASTENASRIAKVIQEEIVHASANEPEVKTISLHTLINHCLEKAQEKDPAFEFHIDKTYDRNVTTITALPWELAYAFSEIIDHHIDSLKRKGKQQPEGYSPKLEICTCAGEDGYHVNLKDNGVAASLNQVETFFLPLFNKKTPAQKNPLGLTLAHDIIVNIHHGKICVESEEERYLHVKITLPRSPY